MSVQNRLSPKHPQRLALETAVRGALAGRRGAWNLVLEAPEGLALVVAVVAPDGSAWTMRYCGPGLEDPESIAETVRTACDRRRWLQRGGAGPRGSRA